MNTGGIFVAAQKMAHRPTRTRRGTALLLVIALGLILGTISSAALLLSTQLAGSTALRRDSIEAQQMADSAGAQVQARLLEDFQRSGLSRGEWLRRLLLPPADPESRYRANEARPDLQPYLQVSAPYIATDPGRYYAAPGAIALPGYPAGSVLARIYELRGPAGGELHNLQIRATAYLGATNQTTVRTLGGEAPEQLNFALVARTPNCQFCHLQVQGNVGALAQFRPGYWHLAQDKSARADVGFDEATGTGGSGSFSGWGDGDRLGVAEDSGANLTDNRLESAIQGEVFTYQFLTNDKNDLDLESGRATRLNGVRLSTEAGGPGRVHARDYGPNFYLWRGLDVDGNGRFDDFPPLDRDGLLRTAQGSIEGQVQAIPFGSTYAPHPLTRLPAIVLGQAVLLGEPPSAANRYCQDATAPLVLQGEVFVEGDVVIRGCLRGQGQIYVGRNLYIAGDLVYQNPPGRTGNYIGYPDPDAAAREDRAAAKDSLRLTANGSIILGDYTEQDSGGTRKFRDRTGAHHLRVRFGLAPGSLAAIKVEGYRLEELTRDLWGNLRTSAGATVPAGAVRQLDRYEALVRPVYFDSVAGLRPWLSDQQYRDLLEEAVPGGMDSVSTWRVNASTERPVAAYPEETLLALAQSPDPARLDACVDFFAQNLNFSSGPVEQDDIERARAVAAQLQARLGGWSEDGLSYLSRGYNQQDWVIDLFNRDTASGATFNVERPTQIQRVDAFLYSARRIGGLVNGTNLVINGGLAAPEVAITAPGVGIQADWVLNPVLNRRIRAKSTGINPLSLTSYNYGAINYDYRLRNGDASLRHLARLTTVESIRFEGNGMAGRQTTNKVCRNAECH